MPSKAKATGAPLAPCVEDRKRSSTCYEAARVRAWLPIVASAVTMLALQALLGDWQFFAYLASLVGVNVILAVSLNIINGMTGQFSIGHAGFFAVGAYSSVLFTTATKAYQ